ncbi:low-specificity L-threonine aldolase [Striga asiatica]|uniref:Low-specificity L-threonine aldolase n=1 Tax=Striga asiatica TaxID=4170 RepID=A0A5A7RFS0_STRAF|nr:low-specificity L-threonine aldolase [Striga asiatica]
MAPIDPQLMEIIQALQDGQAQLQQSHAQLEQAINQVNTRLDATIRVVSARAFNRSIKRNMLLVDFEVLPKQHAGHPFVDPPDVPGLNLNPVCQVGDNPPHGLVPRNFQEWYEALAQLQRDLPISLSRLRAIFWFYNDARLFIAPNATALICDQGWFNVRRYLKK